MSISCYKEELEEFKQAMLAEFDWEEQNKKCASKTKHNTEKT